MPMDRARYPKDWEAIALSVKVKAGAGSVATAANSAYSQGWTNQV